MFVTRSSTGCTRIGGAVMRVRDAVHRSKDVLLLLFDRTVQYTISLPIQKQIQFSVMVYRHKYTWCKIYEKKKKKRERQIYWVSCIRILDYTGSKLEAQMTLGHFYLVHHSSFTYNIITEIKQALHNRVLLPHLFSFQDYRD